jgi:hypothetical protein
MIAMVAGCALVSVPWVIARAGRAWRWPLAGAVLVVSLVLLAGQS